MENDATLVAEVLNNGPEAFAQIIHRYKSIVFGVAVARVRNFHDAEDIAQTVFIEAFERLDDLKDRLAKVILMILIRYHQLEWLLGLCHQHRKAE